MCTLEERRAQLAKKIRLVLTDAQIPQARMARKLAETLGLGRAQSYNKLGGETDYTLPQIAVLEDEFKVRILEIVKDHRHPLDADWVNAELKIGASIISCRILLGTALLDPLNCNFAAYLTAGKWYVCIPALHKIDKPLFSVDKLSWTA
jgi:hypothetical protein